VAIELISYTEMCFSFPNSRAKEEDYEAGRPEIEKRGLLAEAERRMWLG